MGMETHGAKSFFFFENYSKYHVLNNSKSFYHDSNTGWALVKLVTLYDSRSGSNEGHFIHFSKVECLLQTYPTFKVMTRHMFLLLIFLSEFTFTEHRGFVFTQSPDILSECFTRCLFAMTYNSLAKNIWYTRVFLYVRVFCV